MSKLIKFTAQVNMSVISSVFIIVRKYFTYLEPFFLRDKHEVFAIHLFMTVYSKSHEGGLTSESLEIFHGRDGISAVRQILKLTQF